MRTKKPVNPSDLPVVKEVIAFLAEELKSDFAATYDGFGWRVLCDDFDGLYNPIHEHYFAGVRQEFPELRVTFGFIGKQGFDDLYYKNTLHNQKHLTVKLPKRR